MPSLGFQEIAVVLLIALLVFGPKKLPEIGRTLGGAMRELRKAARDFSSSIEQLEAEDDTASHTETDHSHAETDHSHANTEDSPTEKKE